MFFSHQRGFNFNFNHMFFRQRGLSQLKSDWGIGRDERGTYFYRFELTNLFHLQQRKITSVTNMF